MASLRKALCTALVLTMVLACLLAGCATTAAPSPQPTQAPAASAAASASAPAAPAETLKPVKLSWYFPGDYPQKGSDEVYAAANKIVQEKINATVDFKGLNWEDWTNKMQVLMASGDPYDVTFTASWMPPNYYQAVAQGAFLPLDDLLQKYAPKTYAEAPVKFWDATRIGGKIYGVLDYQIAARNLAATFVNDYLTETGFDPKSVNMDLTSFEPFLAAMKEKHPDVVPFQIMDYGDYNVATGNEDLAGGGIPGDTNINDPSMKVFNQYESDTFKNFIKLMKKWNDEGYTHGADMISVQDLNPLTKAKKIAVSLGGTWKPGLDQENSSRFGYPTTSVGLQPKPFVTTAVIVAGLQAISVKSQNPDRAMMFIELMNSDVPLYNTICYGVEGRDFVKNSDGTIEAGKDQQYNPGTDWAFGCQFNAYILKGKPADVWEQTKQMNEQSLTSPMLGFNFDPTPVKDQIAQMNTIVTQYLPGFTLGVLDTDKDYATFMDKLKKAGCDEVITEMQKQVDAWKASK